MRRLGRQTALVLALGGAFALAVAASANALSLGAVAPPNMGGCGSFRYFQSRTAPTTPRYAVPAGPTGLWTITSWSAQGGGSATGRARLRVYRPTTTPLEYKLVKQSRFQAVPPKPPHPKFSTNLNVQKGDLLGLETISGLASAYPSTSNSTVKTVAGGPSGPVTTVGAETPFPFGTLNPAARRRSRPRSFRADRIHPAGEFRHPFG